MARTPDTNAGSPMDRPRSPIRSSPAPDPATHLANDFDWAQRILDAAAKPDAARVLNQKSLDFCESYRERVNGWGRRARIYPKQRDWLKDIESRLKYAGIIG